MTPSRSGQDNSRTPTGRVKADIEDLGNALDAGMIDSASATLSKLSADFSEVEREQNSNGHVPNLTVVPAGDATPLPSALEAEEAMLGGMMLAPAAIRVAAQEVRPEHFFSESHKTIFESILSLDEQGSGVDTVTVCAHLEATGAIKQVSGANGGPGGKKRVHELAAGALTSAKLLLASRRPLARMSCSR